MIKVLALLLLSPFNQRCSWGLISGGRVAASNLHVLPCTLRKSIYLSSIYLSFLERVSSETEHG
jgi:hypothetical protein